MAEFKRMRPDSVRLHISDEEWIELSVTPDGRGLFVRSFPGRLVVMPEVSNVVCIYSDYSRELLVRQEVQHLRDVDKANETSPLRKRKEEPK